MAGSKKPLAILGQTERPVERADAARNRIAILNAARKLLAKRSIGEICMDELAEKAGVGKGTLYRRFADRASLCRALLDDEAMKLQAEVLRGFDLPRHVTWMQRLDRLLDAIFDFVVDNASLLSEAHAFERGEHGRFDHPGHIWQRDAVAVHLKKAAAAGEIEPVREEVTADFILAALDPDLVRWHLDHGASKARLKQDFNTFWRNGVRNR